MFKRKKKTYADDDGRTIVDMNVEGMPWYRPDSGKKKVNDEDKPTRKEVFAMIRAGFRAYLHAFLCILLGFALTIGLLYLWINGWFIGK